MERIRIEVNISPFLWMEFVSSYYFHLTDFLILLSFVGMINWLNKGFQGSVSANMLIYVEVNNDKNLVNDSFLNIFIFSSVRF